MAESPTRARRVALEVMRQLRRGELLDRAVDRAARSLEPRDRAWTRELLYGTQRLRGRLDHLLEARVRSGLESLESDVLDVLRLGAYQLLEMGSVPAYAAISESVDLVRIAGSPRAAGLVNGVLRKVDRERDRVTFPDAGADPVGHLATRGSHPAWLVQRWITRWGYAETERLIEANNRRPELYLRPLVAPRDASAALRDAGVEAEPVPFAPRSLRVVGESDVEAVLAAVAATVQDPAGALVTDFVAVPPGAMVLDLCAAPGGKTVGMAENAEFVVAADLSWRRIGRVRQNVQRIGLSAKTGLVVADGRRSPFRPVDVVLLDAPCTGTGTLRRHPDGRWRVNEEMLSSLVQLQRELLEAAAGLVPPGGVLVYATCSLEAEENAEQVARFLSGHPEFRPAAVDGAVDASLVTAEGFLEVLPQRQGVDGSFAARLRRSE